MSGKQVGWYDGERVHQMNARPVGDVPQHLAHTAGWKAVVVADESPAWRCFHCDEAFTDKAAAREHFGRSERQSPICQIDAAEYRAMEVRMLSYNEDDSDMHRQIYRMQGEHATALIREEEKGYARGLTDARKYPEDLGLCVAPPLTPAMRADAEAIGACCDPLSLEVGDPA